MDLSESRHCAGSASWCDEKENHEVKGILAGFGFPLQRVGKVSRV